MLPLRNSPHAGASTKSPEPPFQPSANAVLILACLMAVAAWTWLYADRFATFTSLAGLTVLLGTVPTLRGFMAKERQEKYVKWLDSALFQSPRAAKLYLAALLVILFVGYGVIQPVTIRAVDPAEPQIVTATFRWNDGAREPDTARLLAEPGKTKREPVRRPIFGGPDRVELSAKSLPALEFALTNFSIRETVYPTDFWRQPALLLHAAPEILAELRNRKPTLTISRVAADATTERCDAQALYLGEPVWIGTGGRALPVDDKTVANWRDAAKLYRLRSGARDILENFVLATSLTADCAKTLAPGDTITWQLVSGGAAASVLHTGEIGITGNETYPIEMELE